MPTLFMLHRETKCGGGEPCCGDPSQTPQARGRRHGTEPRSYRSFFRAKSRSMARTACRLRSHGSP